MSYKPQIIPKRVILLWSGSIATIPAGWALCNGSNGTPDLRNKFVIGADADSGGIAKTTIDGVAKTVGGATVHSHVLSATMGCLTGEDVYPADMWMDENSNLPPYYALAYIMKL